MLNKMILMRVKYPLKKNKISALNHSAHVTKVI
jgi:hypothetical protein